MSLATTASASLIGEDLLAAHASARSITTDESYWLEIRDQFPITKELIYMNNGTMGPSPTPVIDRVTDRIRHVDSTGDYGGDVEAIRKSIAGVLGAASGDEIAFTHNVSEAISIVSSGVDLDAGDEVLMTDQEHGGNAVAWLARKKRDGIAIKFVTLVPNDDEVLQRFSDAITPRTKVIAVPHVTCTTGQVLPIKRLAELAKSKGIWMFVDGAHPPGMMQVNVKDLGVDAYASCGHKWLCGPKGIGFLYITPEFMQHVIPTWAGAESDKYWDYTGTLDFLPTASRYDFATQNFALMDGLHTAIEFMEKIGFERIEARIQHLTGLIRKGLDSVSEGRFYMLTPPTSITGLTTIKLHKMNYYDFSAALITKYKIRTRVVPESKLDANRFSAHIYTSEENIRKFIAAVKAVLA